MKRSLYISILMLALVTLSSCGKDGIEVTETEWLVLENETEETSEYSLETSEEVETTSEEQMEYINRYDIERTEEKVLYATNPLNVRLGPGPTYDCIALVNMGQSVTATGKAANGWTEIKLPGQWGYVNSKYLSETEVELPQLDENGNFDKAKYPSLPDDLIVPRPIPEETESIECEHRWTELEIIDEPDCVHSGSVKRQCTRCGIITISNTEPTGLHSFVLETEPDCSTKAIYFCSVCRELYIGEEGTHVDKDNDGSCDSCFLKLDED